MPKITISQKSALSVQQGGAVTTVLLILLLVPCGWLGYKIGLMYWNQYNIRHAVQFVVADTTLTGIASDDIIFHELTRNLSLERHVHRFQRF